MDIPRLVKPTRALVKRLTALADQIQGALDTPGGGGRARTLMAEFNALTHSSLPPEDFHFASSRSAKEFVEEHLASLGRVPTGLPRATLVELARRVRVGVPEFSDAECLFWIRCVAAHTPMPEGQVSDILTGNDRASEGLDAAAAIDRIMAYRPIALGPGGG